MQGHHLQHHHPAEAARAAGPAMHGSHGHGHGPGHGHGHAHFRAPHFGPFGPGGFAGFGPGQGGGFGGHGGHGGGGRGPRARRGDVRVAILSLLGDSPSNGYGLIKAITERTDGAWRPSPGSVYPTLAQLVDEGLIEPVSDTGPRSDYTLTEAGRQYVAEHDEQIAAAWESVAGAEQDELVLAVGKLMRALRQFATDATAEQRQQMTAKVDGLRRELYRMLAE